MSRLAGTAFALASLGIVLSIPATSFAAFSPAKLVSASPTEQAARSSVNDAVSADGRFVVFRTTSRNLFPPLYVDPPGSFRRGGIFRKDLDSGALDLVALGDRVDSGTGDTVYQGASNPSVSSDGRYVSFQTHEQLTPQDANSATDVYVRDMSRPFDDSAAFELVSALDGSSNPPAYGDDDGASVASPGAISADGRTVVFATASQSNLPAGGAQIGAKQVLARELDGARTTLISEKRDSGTGAMTDEPAGSNLNSLPTARISADAATVVWAGNNAALQTRYVTGNVDAENRRELMWRRVAAGPQDRTRRVSGVDDPDDPGCAPDGSITSTTNPVAGACDGPLKGPHSTSDAIGGGSFAVSADGTKVAFTTSYISRASPETDTDHYDAFVSDMTPGVARKDGLQEITRESSTSAAGNVSGDIGNLDGISISISADGHWIAFPTQRTQFLLPLPTFIGTAPSIANTVQMYAVDLEANTIQLVSRNLDGNPSTGSATAPSLSGDGSRLAFVSTGDDLVVGDGNSQDDVFVSDFADLGGAVPESLPAAFAPKEIGGGSTLRASYKKLKRSRVAIDVVVPGPGTVSARATARTGRRKREVSRGSAISAEGETVTVTLGLSRRLARRAKRSSGLRTRVTLSFRAAGSIQAAAAKSLVVVFGGRPGAGP